jgi:hypothetical protein
MNPIWRAAVVTGLGNVSGGDVLQKVLWAVFARG